MVYTILLRPVSTFRFANPRRIINHPSQNHTNFYQGNRWVGRLSRLPVVDHGGHPQLARRWHGRVAEMPLTPSYHQLGVTVSFHPKKTIPTIAPEGATWSRRFQQQRTRPAQLDPPTDDNSAGHCFHQGARPPEGIQGRRGRARGGQNLCAAP